MEVALNEFGEVIDEVYHYTKPNWTPPSTKIDWTALVMRRRGRTSLRKLSWLEHTSFGDVFLPPDWRINTHRLHT